MYQEFVKRWNLTIYFQLRFQEIAGQLESSLNNTVQITNTSQSSEFVLSCSATLWDCLLQCWSQEIYLSSLGHRFFRLSMQLITRYNNWIQSGIDTHINKADDQSVVPWSSCTSKEWVIINSDLGKISEKIKSVYVNLANKTLGIVQLGSLVEESYGDCISSLEKVLESLGLIICSGISKACEEGLQPLRGIAATYRMTNKSIPIRPSLYVPNILLPLTTFLNQSKMYILESNLSNWTFIIAKTVTEKYLDMLIELLDSVHKSEAVLKKMVKRSQTSHSGAVSDIEKINLQLFLDVEEFGNQLEKFGIDKSSFSPYNQLQNAVATGKKLKDVVSSDNNSTQ